jgi:DNA replication protein DnaC
MDMAEKKSKLVIVTSNYQKDQLIDRYGIRVLDRIIATTFRVKFTGKSFRGEL